MSTLVIDKAPASAAPFLVVDNIEQSIEFYKEVLGFRVDLIETGFALVSRDKVSIMLQQRASGQTRCSGSWAGYVWVDDVDGSHDEFEARGANVTLPVCEMSWGTREFEVQDLDGYQVRFGQILSVSD